MAVVNRLKSKACKGFLFYLNRDELVCFNPSPMLVQIFAVKKEHNLNVKIVASFC